MGIRTKFIIFSLLISIVPLITLMYFIFGYTQSTFNEWSQIAKIDKSLVLESINTLRDIIFIASFTFIIIIVLISLFFVYSITSPIINIVSATKEVHKGSYSKRALVLSKDEIGDLAISFNTMLDSLQAAHKDLEKKVHERTKQLETANKDLESFSYSVSHDLRAPLRSIDGFSQILEEDYTDKLDDEGKHVIATIRKSTQQMGNLIDDLLTFSRLGRLAIKKEPLDMEKIVKEVFVDLQISYPTRSLQLTISAMPKIRGDKTLIRQVWVNLLSNAIKFTKKEKTAFIEIGSEMKKDEVIYFVRDNGVGFNMKYVKKLFGIFQRLHSPQEFEGSGVGLAIIARVVKKHGGKVWAEGKVDQGATFYFSLPKNDINLK